MTITATWVRDKDKFPWRIRMRENRFEGERHYYVNTDLIDLALTAEGLPKYGTPWSTDFPALTVRAYGDPEVLGGKDTSGEGAAGHCKVPVYYSEPDPGRFVQADPRTAYTEIETATEQVYVKLPRRRFLSADGETPGAEETGPPDLINGGDGAPLLVGVVNVSVTTWYPQQDPPDFARFTGLMRPCKVNAAPISLPRFLGTVVRWNLQAGQLLYLGFDRPELDQNYLRVVHRLQASRDFLYRWQREDAKGRAFGGIVLDEIYPPGDLSGLWPQ